MKRVALPCSGWPPAAVRHVAGVTLVELAVAITASAIIIGTVFFAWNHISRHIAVNRRTSLFVTDCRRVAMTLATQLRRADCILAWHDAGITFIRADIGDTVAYEFDGENLLKNDSTVTLVAPTSRLTEFACTAEEQETVRGPFPLLVQISLTFADDFDNTVTLPVAVAVATVRSSDTDQE